MIQETKLRVPNKRRGYRYVGRDLFRGFLSFVHLDETSFGIALMLQNKIKLIDRKSVV